MQIDIDSLSEVELLDLNHRVVARLRYLRESRAHEQMLKFAIGDHVLFRTRDGQEIVGTLTRYNKKSVTVVTAEDDRWTVSPECLQRTDPPSAEKQVSPGEPRIHQIWE